MEKPDIRCFQISSITNSPRKALLILLQNMLIQRRKSSTIVPEKVKPHMFRHSKAMHLLQAGVNLIYIRDFLGHVDIKTTEIYARADTELKRQAIENAYPDLIDSNFLIGIRIKHYLTGFRIEIVQILCKVNYKP